MKTEQEIRATKPTITLTIKIGDESQKASLYKRLDEAGDWF